MYKQGFEEAEEPEIKLSTFVASQRKPGNSRKISTSASLTMLKPLTVWIKIFTNRDQNTCSFKLGLLRFYLQRDILLPETAIGMSPFWRAGQGCRLHPNKPSTHWQHSNAV